MPRLAARRAWLQGIGCYVIVYGDPSTRTSSAELLAHLREALIPFVEHPAADLDQCRALLIRCGQVEQAVEDWLADHPELTGREEVGVALRQVTEAIAALFITRYRGAPDGSEYSLRVREALALLKRVTLPDAELRVKLPEGFAFYALFPEQYVEAARCWHEAQPPDRELVLVVGVRSAGTTLSVVVAAELARLGWPVRRITVRPHGHPFKREVELPGPATSEVHSALVVDEGPGLSGSSMAAVGMALAAAGIPKERIAFLPGHPGEPGSAASEAVRNWWKKTSRHQVSLDELRWPDGNLPQLLARATEALVPEGGTVVQVDDLSWGLWRSHSFTDRSAWPAAALPFERTKYRCSLSDGRSVLWKFEGLAAFDARGVPGAERAALQLDRLAQGGWAEAPLGIRCGFVAVAWCEGEPCSARDRSPELLRHLGRYILACAGPALAADDRVTAHHRLRELLYWNTWEALGPDRAEEAGRWAARLGPTGPDEPTYGDGRMGPWEWIRMPGRVLKVDAAGHAYDHTAVGEQSVLWDVAGALVEWELDRAEQAMLLDAYLASGGATIDEERLAFYQACYAAFRMGLLHLCLGSAPDAEERGRAEAAFNRYRQQLLRLLELMPS